MTELVRQAPDIEPGESAWTAPPRAPHWQPLLALTVSIYAAILVRTAWLHEDAYITFRTIRNLLDGFGPVWNVGERVQAYTHPLWMFLLAGSFWLTGEYYYTAIGVSVAISLLTLYLLVFHHAVSPVAGLVAILLVSFSKAYVDYSTSGLENPLTHLLLVIFALIYFRARYTPRTLFLAALVTGLAILNRMDSGVMFLPGLLYFWWRTGLGRGLWPVVAGMLPVAAWEIFSILYYGFPFPNTAYAKLNTGVSQVEYFQKGALYLLYSTGTDPLTSIVIGVGVVLALISRSWAARGYAAGILLYLLYVVSIGGDYMVGRFLTAPFIAAVAYLVVRPNLVWSRVTTPLILAVILIIGLMSYDQLPLISDSHFALREENAEGVSDERSWYNPPLGLLNSTRHNRAYEMNRIQGYLDPANYVTSGIGRNGFNASSYSHIIDLIGLSDPLIARLPARYNPSWRMGHPERILPPGYAMTQKLGRKTLEDPNLAQYYDKLNLVTRGPLFDSQRLQEIWRLNTGAYDHLIDTDRYRYPNRVSRDAADITRTITATVTLPEPVPLTRDGVLVELGAPQTASILGIGLNLDRFTLFYQRDGATIGTQAIHAQAIKLGEQVYHVVRVPEAVIQQGYTALHLRPDLNGDYDLTYLDLIPAVMDPLAGHAAALHPEQLLELYFYQYYRARRAERAAWLAQLQPAIQQLTPTDWQRVAAAKRVNLLLMPEPVIYDTVLANLPTRIPIADAAGNLVMHYLGGDVTPLGLESTESGVQVRLYFEMVGQLDEEYSVWYFIDSIDTDGKWMIYDQYPDPPVNRWPAGTVQTYEGSIALEPGLYDISFGFWTPDRRRLYIDQAADVYSILIGRYEVPPRPAE